MLEGKSINAIRHSGGLVAGQPEAIDVWVTGGVITVTDPKNVALINGTIAEANRKGWDVKDYLRYVLTEEYGW